MSVFDSHQWFGGSVVPEIANSADSIVTAMNDRGIDRAILFAAHARRVDPVAGNRMLRKVIDQKSGLFGCLITHANRVEASTVVLREQMGYRKFVAMAMVGSDDSAPVDRLLADEIVNAYRRYGKPLLFFTPNAESVHAALEIAQAYSVFRVVLIGMGGEDWRTAIAAAKSSTNIVLEISGSLDRAKIPAAVDALGAHRLIFGSGSPHMDAAAALGLLEDSAISAEARKRILSINAVRLFGLEEEKSAAPEPSIGGAPPLR